jgi:ABC-2 type transport system permease protein
MNRVLWRKCITEAQWLWLALAVLLFAFCWIRVWIVTFFDTSRFQAILEQVWEDYQQFFTVSLAEMLTYAARVGMTYVEPLVIVVIAIWAVARGSSTVSGEISRGTMEMLLAQPISRRQAFTAQVTVTTIGVALLALVSWLGVWIGIEVNTVEIKGAAPTIRLPFLGFEVPNPLGERPSLRVPMSTQVAASDIAPAAFNLFALGFCMTGVVTLVSAWDRYRWRTVGVSTGILVVQFMMKGFGAAAESLAWLKRFTFFTPYEPLKWVSYEAQESGRGWAFVLTDADGQFMSWGPLAHNTLLFCIGLIGLIAAGVVFNRRDLPAPL